MRPNVCRKNVEKYQICRQLDTFFQAANASKPVSAGLRPGLRWGAEEAYDAPQTS